jgi:hypothetical protein
MSVELLDPLRPAGAPPVDARRIAAFDERYGAGAHDRLVEWLRQPCVSFARIAQAFGVTRECVRQWHQVWLPDAPQGRERRRLCRLQRDRRRLMDEPLFQSFYRHVRPHLAPGQLALVPAREGFRKRVVRVGGRLVVIKRARVYRAARVRETPAYALTTYRGSAEFIYFRLSASEYLLLPAHLLPSAGTTFLDTPTSKYRPFRNTVAALTTSFRR